MTHRDRMFYASVFVTGVYGALSGFAWAIPDKTIWDWIAVCFCMTCYMIGITGLCVYFLERDEA